MSEEKHQKAHPDIVPMPEFVQKMMDRLKPEERVKVIGAYCQFCGHYREVPGPVCCYCGR